MVGKSGRALKAGALTLAVVAFAVTPLIAQYLKQQTMVSDENVAAVAPVVVTHAPGTVPRSARRPAHKKIAHRKPVHVAMALPAAVRQPAHAVHAAAQPKRAAHLRVAHRRASAKRTVALVPRARNHRVARRGAHRRAARPARIAKADLARSAVTGYLERVIAGEIPDAPEKRIVSAWTDIHIRYVRPDGPGIRLGVELSGPQGRYFEVFLVKRSDLQILQHSFVQV